jgi:GTP pyrophosphokinase
MLNTLDQIKKNSGETELIERAFQFALTSHREQKRLSGEDYMFHPLRVALTLSRAKLDPKTITAGLLHDVPDDTQFSLEDIEKKFGKEVAFLISGVSKLGKLRYPKEGLKIKSIENRQTQPLNPRAENLRKMFFAMAEDLRVILIKLADRLDNMRTLNHLPKERQKRIALETLEIFAPLADRLGMGEMKRQLEELSFLYLYPKEYSWLVRQVKERYEERKRYLKRIEPKIKEILRKEGIVSLDIHSRAKSYWSLYQKLLRNEMNFDRIHDLVALRIIVKNLESCYRTLGVLHKHFKPLVGKIQDFIALPKPNGYQSLHTTCFCLEGKLIEFQIRTPEMHEKAENGICAHWAYKEKVDLKTKTRKFSWVEQLREWQKGISGTKEFLEGLKIDFFKNRIFVFTPKGDIIDLPEGACPVDFAYQVHTEIGNHCAGAKVNGKMVALSTPLKNGDLVEIIVDKTKEPNRDWLKFIKTSLARSHIKKKSKVGFLEIIGEKIFPKKLVKKIFKEKERLIPPKKKISPRVVIGGKTDISLSFAKCCNPKSGDRIIAYVTKNKGASIHRFSCENLKRVQAKWPQKIIKASWSF